LQIFSTKYLIYTWECLKLIDGVIKFINWNFYAIRYLYYGTVWSHLNCMQVEQQVKPSMHGQHISLYIESLYSFSCPSPCLI
jgi:hypothetical protein